MYNDFDFTIRATEQVSMYNSNVPLIWLALMLLVALPVTMKLVYSKVLSDSYCGLAMIVPIMVAGSLAIVFSYVAKLLVA